MGSYEHVIDPWKKITIKECDKEDRSSKGLIVLPIWVGSIEKEMVYQVLDLPLA